MIFVYLFVLIAILIVCLFFLLFFIFQVIAHFTVDAPFVTIPNGIDEDIVRSLKLKEGSVLYDLGCGDARVLLTAARMHPNIQAIGIEKALWPFLLAKWKTKKYKNISIHRGDIFTADISSATHIFIYLYPHVLTKLFPKIQAECKPKTLIASCDFEASGQHPTEIIELHSTDSKRGKRLFIYENIKH